MLLIFFISCILLTRYLLKLYLVHTMYSYCYIDKNIILRDQFAATATLRKIIESII